MLTSLRNGLTTLVFLWVHDCTCPRIVPKASRPTSARISTLRLSSHQQIRLLNCSWTAPLCKTSTKRHQHMWTFRIRNPAHLFWTLWYLCGFVTGCWGNLCIGEACNMVFGNNWRGRLNTIWERDIPCLCPFCLALIKNFITP